jgi:hypothetical protein
MDPHGGSCGGLPDAPFGLTGSHGLLRHPPVHLCQSRTVRYTLHFRSRLGTVVRRVSARKILYQWQFACALQPGLRNLRSRVSVCRDGANCGMSVNQTQREDEERELMRVLFDAGFVDLPDAEVKAVLSETSLGTDHLLALCTVH